jgi:hypothetical protein
MEKLILAIALIAFFPLFSFSAFADIAPLPPQAFQDPINEITPLQVFRDSINELFALILTICLVVAFVLWFLESRKVKRRRAGKLRREKNARKNEEKMR